MTRNLYIVDVFAERLYAGNQLAVVIASEDHSDEKMQQIAAEMNFSETTFVKSVPEDDGGYRVRIFTPAWEIPFAGHPTLGTAWVIRHHLAPESSDGVRLHLKVGPVPVTFESSNDGKEVVWFLAPAVKLGPTRDAGPIAKVLGISEADIETKVPIQQVTAGTSATIVPLRSLDALKRIKIDPGAFAALSGEGFPSLVYSFCRETHNAENDLCARFFFDAHGPREDPATGSAAAFLGAYLLEHQFLGSDLSLRIEQGYEIHRPSLIMLRARTADGSREVRVGGQVIPIVRGSLL